MYKKNIKLFNNNDIAIFGPEEKVEAFASALTGLNGNERNDRLVIQRLLDDAGAGLSVTYSGNTVYPSKRLTNELKRMKKTGSIEKMSKGMYLFLSQHFDIAHYNQQGFIDTYDGEYSSMMHCIARNVMNYENSCFTDIVKIIRDSGLLKDAETTRGYDF